MPLNASLKWPLLIVSTLGVVLSTILIIWLTFDLPGQGVLLVSGQTSQNLNTHGAVVALPQPQRTGLPIRLKIPTLKVDAAVVNVGLTAAGAMDIPKGPKDVAWFEPGQRPGENGSAVMAGHFGWKDGISAVFDNLHRVKVGDKVYIEDDQGATTTFVVRELRTFGQKDDATAVFRSSDNQAHLNLITCQGIWNKAKHSYSNRLVVFTNKET